MSIEQWIMQLQDKKGCEERISLLEHLPSVESQLILPHIRSFYQQLRVPEHKQAFLTLVALDAASLLFDIAGKTKSLQEMELLLSRFAEVENFYQERGGIMGYVQLVKKAVRQPKKKIEKESYSIPVSEKLEQEGTFIKHISLFGLAHLDRVSCIVTAGGLGVRLGLADNTGHPLPVAHLPFMGHTLIEGVIRDLEGLEQLYFATFGRKIVIPLALMTSKEHDNEKQIRALFESHHHFGRPLSSIRFFSQLSVPVMTIHGTFAASGPAEFLFHPAGHGALWRSAHESGIFRWLEDQRIEHLILRQINNPLAGLDHNLLAFLGLAIKQKKEFGFLACERLSGAAEGALVDKEEGGYHCITNIEYNQLESHDSVEGLANTNILYVKLKALHPRIHKGELFGPMVNMKSDVPNMLPTGKVESVKGGRLESMMQSIAESFIAKKGEPLPTIVVEGRRAKVMGAIKRPFEAGKSALETAEAAHYAWLQNSYELLRSCTLIDLPAFSSFEEYLNQGPTLLFSYHPILGPLYDVIRQKVACKSIASKSELQLEIAAFACQGLQLSGSLRIDGIEGRCTLQGVTIQNRGVHWERSAPYWRGEYVRYESCHIVIGEGGELVAENVVLQGNQRIEVPPEHRLVLSQDEDGQLLLTEIPLGNFLNPQQYRQK